LGPPFPIQEQRFNDFSPVGIANRLHRCPVTENWNLLISPSLDLLLDFFSKLFSYLGITKDIVNDFLINLRPRAVPGSRRISSTISSSTFARALFRFGNSATISSAV